MPYFSYFLHDKDGGFMIEKTTTTTATDEFDHQNQLQKKEEKDSLQSFSRLQCYRKSELESISATKNCDVYFFGERNGIVNNHNNRRHCDSHYNQHLLSLSSSSWRRIPSPLTTVQHLLRPHRTTPSSPYSTIKIRRTRSRLRHSIKPAFGNHFLTLFSATGRSVFLFILAAIIIIPNHRGVWAGDGMYYGPAKVVKDSYNPCAFGIAGKDGVGGGIKSGNICQNSTCVSVCASKGLKPCQCASQADRDCYQCCGSSSKPCKPAHHYHIYRPNGERWETKACRYCRGNDDGLVCDDKDDNKLCKDGRCTAELCQDLKEGQVCDKAHEKICIENRCINPCGVRSFCALQPGRMLCECDKIRRTMEISSDRCQLCCFDFELKRCETAVNLGILPLGSKRTIPRTGLTCERGKTCNRYAVCSAPSIHYRQQQGQFSLIQRFDSHHISQTLTNVILKSRLDSTFIPSIITASFTVSTSTILIVITYLIGLMALGRILSSV